MSNKFLQHLPERFLAVERNWNQVNQQPGNRILLEALLGRIQDLVGISGKAGQIDISETCYTLESHLSNFLDKQTGFPLTQELLNRIGERIETLKKQVNNAVANQYASSLNLGNRVAFFLRASDEITPGLVSALEGAGFSVLAFMHPEDAEGEIQKRIPDILIFEGSFLNQMENLNRTIEFQEKRSNKKIPTICLSSDKKLEQRLLALRQGVDAYLLLPHPTDKLVQQVLDLTSPKDQAYRILIVEDDPSQAKFASSILKKGGMKTLTVTDPLKALEALNDFKPDLILMDLYMPGADGQELTTIIREHPDYITTPIVFLSGEDDTDKKLHALSAGADDFLTKPIRPKYLIETIMNRVQRAKSLSAKPGLKRESTTETSGSAAQHVMYEQLEQLLASSQSGARPGGLLYLHFTLGESSGTTDQDGLVSEFMRELQELANGLIGEGDALAQIDRGLAILSGNAVASELLTLAGRLQRTIRHHYFSHQGEEIRLRSSIGICLFDEDINSADQMIDRASSTAVEALKGGGDRILIHDADQHLGGEQDNSNIIHHLLDSAIREKDFQVIFSPLISRLESDEETSDLILRLRQGRKILPMNEWRPVAVDRGLIGDIDRISITHALSALELKRREGKQIKIFLSQYYQSAAELSNIEWLLEQFRTHQIVGTGLVFEYSIIELAHDLKHSKNFISELADMGIEVSLARFSANTTAMRILQYLQTQYVKLSIQALKIPADRAEKLVREVHIMGAKLILPRVSDQTVIPDHWQRLADLQPGT